MGKGPKIINPIRGMDNPYSNCYINVIFQSILHLNGVKDMMLKGLLGKTIQDLCSNYFKLPSYEVYIWKEKTVQELTGLEHLDNQHYDADEFYLPYTKLGFKPSF